MIPKFKKLHKKFMNERKNNWKIVFAFLLIFGSTYVFGDFGQAWFSAVVSIIVVCWTNTSISKECEEMLQSIYRDKSWSYEVELIPFLADFTRHQDTVGNASAILTEILDMCVKEKETVHNMITTNMVESMERVLAQNKVNGYTQDEIIKFLGEFGNKNSIRFIQKSQGNGQKGFVNNQVIEDAINKIDERIKQTQYLRPANAPSDLLRACDTAKTGNQELLLRTIE